MHNPLENVPLNLESAFVMATTNDGCEIYMPVKIGRVGEEITKGQQKFLDRKKKELQDYLEWKDPPVLPEAA